MTDIAKIKSNLFTMTNDKKTAREVGMGLSGKQSTNGPIYGDIIL